jgi:hypothetical protein
MHPEDLPEASIERERYLHHHNEVDDEQYAKYIRALVDQLIARVPPGKTGLDYGCGPVCFVEAELERLGFHVNSFDPFFHNHPEYLVSQYDFIFCCETAEHFHNPHREFSLFQRTLKPGGLLQLVTQFYSDSQSFDKWWYPRDFTHVCFYSEVTMRWIANRFQWSLELPGSNITVFESDASIIE